MPKDDFDLAALTNDDLLQELGRRFDAFVFLGQKTLGNGQETIYPEWGGGNWTLLGLCDYQQQLVRRMIDQKFANDSAD